MTDGRGRTTAEPEGEGPLPSEVRASPGPATVMGLKFANRLGLAAGIDRTGASLARLARCGVGHVEIGTLKEARSMAIDCSTLPCGIVVGANIGSARPGVDDDVIEDYARMLAAVSDVADYVVANMSSPLDGRDAETPGVDRLLARLKAEQSRLVSAGAKRRPLLLKTDAGLAGSAVPSAILAARGAGIDGVVLVSACVRRLGEIVDHLKGLPVVSVGGVTCAQDVLERLAAGAALVQMHTLYDNEGPEAVEAIVRDLDALAVRS